MSWHMNAYEYSHGCKQGGLNLCVPLLKAPSGGELQAGTAFVARVRAVDAPVDVARF